MIEGADFLMIQSLPFKSWPSMAASLHTSLGSTSFSDTLIATSENKRQIDFVYWKPDNPFEDFLTPPMCEMCLRS